MEDFREKKPMILGWREWVSLPELGIPAIKAKLDTGARTSALHTFFLETFKLSGKDMIRFGIHPIQKRDDIEIFCEAEIVDQRRVTDSGGHPEMRWVILTPITLKDRTWPVEITLTNRETMLFRMLLGRTAMHAGIWVDPSASHVTGRSLEKKYSHYHKPGGSGENSNPVEGA